MATARNAAGSVFDSVTACSGALTQTFNTVGDSIAMLSDFVRKHRTMQQLSIKMELEDFEVNLVRDATVEDIKRRIEIQKFMDDNPEYVEQFNKELERRKALLRSDENAK